MGILENVDNKNISTNDASQVEKWVNVCNQHDLTENSGVCALLQTISSQSNSDFQQIALFYVPSMTKVFAVSNWDPIGKANVMYRGIIGSIENEPMISSPLYKQHFSLLTGQCVEQNEVKLDVFDAKLENGQVYVNPIALTISSPANVA